MQCSLLYIKHTKKLICMLYLTDNTLYIRPFDSDAKY